MFLVALSVRSRIVFGLVLVALIFVPLEKLWALHPQRTFRKGWASDVVHFVVNNLLSTIGIVVAVVAIGSGLAAARLHPIDQAFTRSCFVIPLYALGFTRATFGALLVLFALQALFIHANVRLTFGPLRYVLATPEFHHWHHAGDPVVYNSNFAGELAVLDMLFGTMHLPKGEWPQSYGIAEPVPDGYLRQLAWPFRHAHHDRPG